MLNIRSLTCGYDGKMVLHEINLALDAGKILAVIGPNGAGKSTLVKAISGVIPVTGGTIEWAGTNLFAMKPEERARQVSVVAQARNLPPAFTAWEVVALGRTPYLNWLGQVSPSDEEIIASAMRQTGTLELANRMTGELSGGEQQRLFLARALAQQTPLMLLDEPTSHLDLQYQIQLIHLLRKIIPGTDKAAVIVMHDLNLAARVADQVVLLVDGRVAASGTPDEVLTAELLGRAYRVPLGIFRDPETGTNVIVPHNGVPDL
jgi:iron complex transport system ATP-binding protein